MFDIATFFQQVSAAAFALKELRWAEHVNQGGTGLYGPTVRRHGDLPEMAALVSAGLLRLLPTGYWLTEAGSMALAQHPPR
jgi:hypothetical protein